MLPVQFIIAEKKIEKKTVNKLKSESFKEYILKNWRENFKGLNYDPKSLLETVCAFFFLLSFKEE